MTDGHRIEPTILRAYDIRGIVGDTLDSADAYAVGRAFATLAAQRCGAGPKLCVGYDGRLSSPMLESALIEGLTASGAQVVRIGLGPTPMLYFAAKALDAAGGIMVTGSHNPSDFNGFKMTLDGAAFWDQDIQELGRIAASGAFSDTTGTVDAYRIQSDYVDRLAAVYRTDVPLRIAWDPGNGAAGPATAAVTARLPGHHVVLNGEVDGSFPAHHPDPTVADNLAQLIDTVTRESCDFGIGFDGDGDRLGVVDGTGAILWGDQLLCLLAEDVLSDLPGATIIADVKASQVLFDHVAKLGGRPLMWRTGHSPIKSKMAETGAPLAGEMSGHIFFADRYYGFDDALYAAMRLLDYVARVGMSLAALRGRLPVMINTPELRFDCADTRKFAVVDEVARRLADRDADVVDVDGVRVNTADGWWLLRASNTQPVLVARCEARDQAGLERLKAALVSELSASGIAPPVF